MPFDTPVPEPAPSRRSRRAGVRQDAAPGDPTTTADSHIAAAVDAPLTRRAARALAAAASGTDKTAREPSPMLTVQDATDLSVTDVSATDLSMTAPVETMTFALLEPTAPLATDDETPEATPAVDAFEAAARLFSFTGETPVQAARAPEAADDTVEEPTDHVAPRGRGVRGAKQTPRRTGASFRRVAAASFSVGAMAIAGLLAVGMTTPAVAVAASSTAGDAALKVQVPAGDVVVDTEQIQAYVAPAQVENVEIDRSTGSYETASLRDVAAAEGVTTFSSFFTNDPTAAIQWPFAVGVPMTFGYGMRWGRMHTGIDLTPGNGAEIHAIADGVVRSASDATGGYGVNIYIDHIIDGKVVTSHYAHMQYGSMRVKAGDHVKVGQVIGLVGNTGHSFGAHLHFEILLNGTQLVDPLPWMRANAGRQSLGD